jgi:hypothetical protein
MLKPVLICGGESWTPTKWDEQKLRASERKVLRKIYGPIRQKEGWRIKYNYELFDRHCPRALHSIAYK